MRPLLVVLSDQAEHTSQELVIKLSELYNLSQDQRSALLPSGKQPIMTNRVGWARTYMSKAKLIETTRRGAYRITPEGLNFLHANQLINTRTLYSVPEFANWQSASKVAIEAPSISEPGAGLAITKTPQELLDESFSQIREELASELLERVKQCSPAAFERIVVDLILQMGYGGFRKDAGSIVGKSGDGGIDGIIKEDKLGLDMIYIQAKKWENQVTISSVRDFAGSLLSHKAKKGIFITTATFPASAYEFVKNIEHKIVLIDGKELAQLMIEFNVGASVKDIYELKRIDTDYFEEL